MYQPCDLIGILMPSRWAHLSHHFIIWRYDGIVVEWCHSKCALLIDANIHMMCRERPALAPASYLSFSLSLSRFCLAFLFILKARARIQKMRATFTSLLCSSLAGHHAHGHGFGFGFYQRYSWSLLSFSLTHDLRSAHQKCALYFEACVYRHNCLCRMCSFSWPLSISMRQWGSQILNFSVMTKKSQIWRAIPNRNRPKCASYILVTVITDQRSLISDHWSVISRNVSLQYLLQFLPFRSRLSHSCKYLHHTSITFSSLFNVIKLNGCLLLAHRTHSKGSDESTAHAPER